MRNQGIGIDLNIGEDDNFEVGSDYCHSVESYHSRQSDDEDANENATVVAYEEEFYTYDKDNPKMEVGAMYPNVVAFRRALNHYVILNDFEYEVVKSDLVRMTATCSNPECRWRIHASVSEDEVTFIVRTLQNNHTCYGVNKRDKKHATTGWIVERIIDDLRNEDIVAKELKRRLETKFGISIPYRRVWDGKEAALREIHRNWKDLLVQAGVLRDELKRRNPGSIVELKTEIVGGNHHFQRFFIVLGPCTTGFLMGCRPYICLDACHLKGKWKGVLAAATAIDGNNCIFSIAFAVMEGESEESWEWFLILLKKENISY